MFEEGLLIKNLIQQRYYFNENFTYQDTVFAIHYITHINRDHIELWSK